MADLARAARRRGIKPPTTATLRRYGIVEGDWLALLAAQGWRCPVCERAAGGLRLNVDHEHVPGWKRMPPEERATYVRGVICVRCNWRVVGHHADPDELERVVDYLRAYDARKRGTP